MTRGWLLLLLPLFVPLLPAQSSQVQAALAAGTYLPLDVGNRWVFRIDTRSVTAAYETWRVDRTQVIDGTTWSVIAIENATTGALLAESYFRAGEQDRVYTLTGAGEQLFLDPASQSGAVLQVTGRVNSFGTAVGRFPDALFYNNSMGLIFETGTLVRGIGVVSSEQNMISGSSGGLTLGRRLVEASLAGGLQFTASSPSIELGVESLTLDVTGKQVTNCAVPCYFVACGLAPGADPPDTYKPCARTKVKLANWPAGASRSVRLKLLSPDGTAVYEQTATADSAPEAGVAFLQLPLYSSPNHPFPAGAYQLQATTGDAIAQAAITLKIQ